MLAIEGFEWARDAVPSTGVEMLRVEAGRLAAEEPAAAHGIRDLIRKSRVVREALSEPWLLDLVPSGHACVRGILFDKTPDANWLVAWHQDLTVCVQERSEVEGHGPWSVKHGVPHVQPPVELLAEMVTLRLHLDLTHAGNGALRVIPRSHREGRLDAAQI
ncbi:MAG: Phytanoyl-CoA dioxygenase, partial [Verrucomicrobiaceae bacterium]|nr:Phytanoyl-CoA dioxygenase [Verrucomicrobiaceae bacterium]